uniref:Uncharacterized protein n=1 Tax=Romanomermis culicivorax TaxID=13658 RepID=A0A915HKF6_ROMCU
MYDWHWHQRMCLGSGTSTCISKKKWHQDIPNKNTGQENEPRENPASASIDGQNWLVFSQSSNNGRVESK